MVTDTIVNVFLKRSMYSYGVDVHTDLEIFSFFLRKSIYGHILESWVLLEVLTNAKVINRIFLKLDDK